MNCSVSRNNHSLRILAIALVLMMLVSVLPISCALGESDEPDEVFTKVRRLTAPVLFAAL